MDSSSNRGPAGFRLQNSSPALGCLVTVLGLGLALAVALVGFFVVLIMPVVLLITGIARKALGRTETSVQAMRQSESEVGAIDVESTVLPPEHDRQRH